MLRFSTHLLIGLLAISAAHAQLISPIETDGLPIPSTVPSTTPEQPIPTSVPFAMPNLRDFAVTPQDALQIQTRAHVAESPECPTDLMARFAHKILGNNDIGWNLQLESLAAPVPVYVDAHFSILSSYRTELAIQGAPLVRLPDETLPMGTGFKWNHRMDFDAATTGTHTFSLPVKAAADRENFTVLGGEVLNYMFTIAYDIGAGPGIYLQCTSPMYTMNGQGSLVQQQLQQQQVEKEWE